MAEKLLMLALSPTMETGVISKWLKQEGDPVESGDVLCEVETDKAMMDYESPASGTLLKIVVPEGSSASIGDLIAIVGKQGEDISGLLGAAEAAGTAGAAIQTAVGNSGATGSGASGTPGAAPAEPQAPSEPAQPAQPATAQPAAEPTATPAASQPSSSATVQAPPQAVAQATTQPAAQPAQPASQAEQPAATQTAEGASGFIRSTPLARKLADMNNVKLDTVAGSGPEGRIIKADIEKAMAAPAAQPVSAPAATAPAVQPGMTQTTAAPAAAAPSAAAPSAAAPSAAPAAPSAPAAKPAPAPAPAALVAAGPGDVAIPVSGKRRIIAQRLSESMFSAPHYYLEVRVEMDEMMAMRGQLNEGAETKVSINAVLMKFVAEALKRHPIVNSTWAGDTIIRRGRIDIGLAVAQEDGLITPVVRDCGNKGMLQIETELKDLIQRARSNALKPEEYTGATFTISSLGSFGIEAFTAIINPPGSAILAVGEIRKEAVVQPDESLKVRSVMRLTLSCDHRVIDGAVGAAFLAQLRDMLEQPICAIY